MHVFWHVLLVLYVLLCPNAKLHGFTWACFFFFRTLCRVVAFYIARFCMSLFFCARCKMRDTKWQHGFIWTCLFASCVESHNSTWACLFAPCIQSHISTRALSFCALCKIVWFCMTCLFVHYAKLHGFIWVFFFFVPPYVELQHGFIRACLFVSYVESHIFAQWAWSTQF